MRKLVLRVCFIGLFSTTSYALPPTLVAVNKQTIDLSSYFSPGSTLQEVNLFSNIISGFVSGPQTGLFILKDSVASVHSNPGGAIQFVGFGQDRVYGSNRYFDTITRNETLLSFANAPINFTSFSISSASGNKVYGQYNQSGPMMMPKYFFGTVNNDNSISWQDAPTSDADGTFYFKGISGNTAFGSYMANSNNPNYTPKGLLYDITSGNKTFLEVPESYGSLVDFVTGGNVYGTYNFVVSQNPNMTGPGSYLLETRGYVYDGQKISTLAFEDPSVSGGYDFSSFSRPSGSSSTTSSFSADGNTVAVSGNTSSTSFITAQLPEPSALSLCAVGLSGWAMMRRRRS